MSAGEDNFEGMSDDEWEDLVAEIKEGHCTPFLGAGASAPLPTGDVLARKLAMKFSLKVEADANLPRVAQNVSLLRNAGFDAMRRYVRDECMASGVPDFKQKTQLHRVLAGLPLSIYLTTNYDNFMAEALNEVRRQPIVELCRWFSVGWDESDAERQSGSRAAEATIEKPLVFHLHGAFSKLQSMVLTEDDYLDFLTVTSVRKWLVPSNVESSFAETTLLFLGYSLEDMTFKVLLRRISTTMRRYDKSHLTVQLRPHSDFDDPVARQRIDIREEYVRRLLGSKARVYWGSCDQFAGELAARWRGG